MAMQAIRGLRSHFEIWFTLAMLGVTFGLAWLLDLPLITPTQNSAQFVGIHYLIPVLGVFAWAVVAFLKKDMKRTWTFLVALPSYAVILWCHFNIKLWAPLINRTVYDELYWNIDTALRPLVEACFSLRMMMTPVISLDSNFYMIGFIALFYISFISHAFKSYQVFRTLFIAALVFQALGALSYLIAPALGPFIYESGIDLRAAGAQQSMLAFNQMIMAGGSDWLALNGSPGFIQGLAAMPSLHSGGAFLFFMFACRNTRLLVPLYGAVTLFIFIGAVSTRWHYLVDIPAGVLLAWLSIWISDRLCREQPGSVTETPQAARVSNGWAEAKPVGQE